MRVYPELHSVHEKKIESVGNRIASNAIRKYMQLSEEDKNKTLLISPTKKVYDLKMMQG